jgi:hypothetical protein
LGQVGGAKQERQGRQRARQCGVTETSLHVQNPLSSSRHEDATSTSDQQIEGTLSRRRRFPAHISSLLRTLRLAVAAEPQLFPSPYGEADGTSFGYSGLDHSDQAAGPLKLFEFSPKKAGNIRPMAGVYHRGEAGAGGKGIA